MGWQPRKDIRCRQQKKNEQIEQGLDADFDSEILIVKKVKRQYKEKKEEEKMQGKGIRKKIKKQQKGRKRRSKEMEKHRLLPVLLFRI